MNHETLLSLRRSLSVFFLSLASCSTRWGSGCGRSSGRHLASVVMVEPTAGHSRQCAQHIVQMATQFGAELDLDREQAC